MTYSLLDIFSDCYPNNITDKSSKRHINYLFLSFSLFSLKLNAFCLCILEHEHSNDEKKLLSLLQESQEERDELLSQQVW